MSVMGPRRCFCCGKEERTTGCVRGMLCDCNQTLAGAFSFQPSRWLGDVRTDLLTDAQRDGLENAKLIAVERRKVEARIPRELRFVKGWPTFVPDLEQCALLAGIRMRVGEVTGLPVRFTTAEVVRDRYQELFDKKQEAVTGQ